MKIKICCIRSLQEAELAVRCGASALGFVSKMPVGSGFLTDDEIKAIVAKLPAGPMSVLLTPRTVPEEIAAQHSPIGSAALQLVAPISPEDVLALKALLPRVQLIKVIHVEDEHSFDYARTYFESADMLLLDTKVRRQDGEALGGTGQTHDWSVSQKIAKAAPVPVYLAGGLTPQNVGEAAARVRPSGVDVCSALRPEGGLDAPRLDAFVKAARGEAE